MPFELAAIGTALGALKTIAEIAKNVNNIELNRKLIDLQSSLMDMQQHMTELFEENHVLKNQMEEQKKLQEIGGDMEYVDDGGFFVRKSERLVGKNISYCPACWGDSRKDVPLNPLSGRGVFRCEIHTSAVYQTAASRNQQKSGIRTIAKMDFGPWS